MGAGFEALIIVFSIIAYITLAILIGKLYRNWYLARKFAESVSKSKALSELSGADAMIGMLWPISLPIWSTCLLTESVGKNFFLDVYARHQKEEDERVAKKRAEIARKVAVAEMEREVLDEPFA